MVRLSGMDAVSLHTEISTMPSHTVLAIVIEASDQLSHERLHKLVGSSLPRLARFRSRLIDKPLRLGQPVWAEIDDFNPARQLRRLAVPAPGGMDEFRDLIAKLTTRPLDRHLPLWQAWSIEGLRGGRWALALKMSQATTGGVGGIPTVLQRLLTAGPDDDPVSDLPLEESLGKKPSILGLVADAAAEFAENQLAGARLLGAAVPEALRAAAGVLGGSAQHNGVPVPRTVFNEPLTERRAVAFASIPLADIHAVTEAFGAGVNDVFLAACTVSVRTWLQRHHSLPDYPLVMAVPLPEGGFFGSVRLPVQVDDPVWKLREVQNETPAAEASLPKLAGLVAPSVVHAGMQLYAGLGLSKRLPPISHGLAACIPGPSVPAHCAGSKVAAVYAVPPLVEGAGLNLSAVTHGGADGEVMDVSVCVCPDHVTGVESIADGIADGVGQLRNMRKKANRRKSP